MSDTIHIKRHSKYKSRNGRKIDRVVIDQAIAYLIMQAGWAYHEAANIIRWRAKEGLSLFPRKVID